MRADRVMEVLVIDLHAATATTTVAQRNPVRVVDVAVSAGVVDENGEQLLRLGSCQATYADESLGGLLTAIAEAEQIQDARFVVVQGHSPASTSGPIADRRPGAIRWELHKDRWPGDPPPLARSG